jgi:hypothetical protein
MYPMQNSTVGGTPPPQDAEKPTVRKTRTPTKFPLPSDRVPFGRHFDVLGGFMAASRNGKEPVSAVSVEGGGLPAQSAQLNTGFLVSIALLEEPERGKFRPSPEAMRLLVAKSVSDERASPILRSLIENTWFADAARGLLARKPVVADEDLLAELTLAAGTDAGRKADALRVLVDYLAYAGIVVRTEHGLVAGSPTVSGVAQPTAVSPAPMLAYGFNPEVAKFIGPSGIVPMAAPETTVRAFFAPSGVAPVSQTSVRFNVGPMALPPEADWRIIQTNDFYVKVRPTHEAVADLRDHLELLDRRLKQAEKPAPPAVTEDKP